MFSIVVMDMFNHSTIMRRPHGTHIAQNARKGLAKGLAKGREEGLAKGRAEERIEIARNMKAKGLPVDLIAECSGLSPEEIAQL